MVCEYFRNPPCLNLEIDITFALHNCNGFLVLLGGNNYAITSFVWSSESLNLSGESACPVVLYIVN